MTIASKLRLGSRQRKILRSCSSLGFVGLMIASACTDEVGGDGYEPPRPTAGTSADGGVVNTGGMEDDGGAPLQPGAGKGGSSSTAGKASGGKASGGKGGKGGGGTVPEGGGGATEMPGSVCGNMAIEAGEQCDDGNTKSGDGCTADCKSDCEVCEKTFCKQVHSAEAGEFNSVNNIVYEPYDPYVNCFQAEGMAKTGPAQGIPLADLCLGVVDCVRQEQCAQLEDINLLGAATATSQGFLHCYCSFDVTSPKYKNTCEQPSALDPKVDPNYIGKCKREFQEASEGDGASTIFAGFQGKKKALALAYQLLLTCDRSLCTEECLPQITTGVVGQISADIVVANNDAGESPFGDLMADSQRAATGTDFAFVQNMAFQAREGWGPSGLLFHAAPGRPADAEGRLLHSELRQVIFGYYPGTNLGNEFYLGQRLVTLKATGQQVYDLLQQASGGGPSDQFLQVSGLTFKWTPSKSRIDEVRKNGTLLDKAATYTVTVDSAVKVAGATDLVTTDKTPESALVSYLKSLPQPISPPALDRITLSPPAN